MAIRIVTDSTADLTAPLMREFGVEGRVHVVPLSVHFGDREYRDGVDLDTATFYRMLGEAREMPRTSQPSPADFVEVYGAVSEPGDTVISLHISSKLSGTYQSALLAARQFNDRRIEVVDTRTVSLGLGLIALQAAKMAAEGADPDAILVRCREMMGGTLLIGLLDTLEYLHRNGRIGKAQAMVGGLLNVKPILTIEDGVVAPLDKVRGKAKGRQRLLEHAVALAPPERAYLGAIVHAQAAEEATSFREAVAARYPGCRLVVGEMGPTVGTHSGPGLVGVILFVR